jgi:hypothetical protein
MVFRDGLRPAESVLAFSQNRVQTIDYIEIEGAGSDIFDPDPPANTGNQDDNSSGSADVAGSSGGCFLFCL